MTSSPQRAPEHPDLNDPPDSPHVDQAFAVLTRMHDDLLFLIQVAVDERDYDLAERISTLRNHFTDPIHHIVNRTGGRTR